MNKNFKKYVYFFLLFRYGASKMKNITMTNKYAHSASKLYMRVCAYDFGFRGCLSHTLSSVLLTKLNMLNELLLFFFHFFILFFISFIIFFFSQSWLASHSLLRSQFVFFACLQLNSSYENRPHRFSLKLPFVAVVFILFHSVRIFFFFIFAFVYYTEQ